MMLMRVIMMTWMKVVMVVLVVILTTKNILKHFQYFHEIIFNSISIIFVFVFYLYATQIILQEEKRCKNAEGAEGA